MNTPMQSGRPHARPTDAELLAGRLNNGWTMCECATNRLMRQRGGET